MGSWFYLCIPSGIEGESLSEKQDEIQTKMFQNIATIENTFFLLCSESPGWLSDTPDAQHLAYDTEMERHISFLKKIVLHYLE